MIMKGNHDMNYSIGIGYEDNRDKRLMILCINDMMKTLIGTRHEGYSLEYNSENKTMTVYTVTDEALSIICVGLEKAGFDMKPRV